MKDEDYAHDLWKQAKIERDWNNLPIAPHCHAKIGTVIPFSRTADRDPNPRIPLSVESYPHMSLWERAFWIILTSAIITLLITGDVFANPEEVRLNQERMLQLQEQQVLIQQQQLDMQRRQMQQNTPVYVRELPDYGSIISRAVKQYQEQQGK